MTFVQDMSYDLLLNTHAETMLAWRYGIQGSETDDGVHLEVFFRKEVGQRAGRSGRIDAIFAAGSARRVRLIVDVESMRVVTALATDQVFQTADASAISHMLDAIRAVERELMSVAEIVEWRDSYIEANGGLSKDDLRRMLTKRAPNFSPTDPFQALGIEPSFFDEVATLREAVFWTDEYLQNYDASHGLLPVSVDGILKLYPHFRESLGEKEVFQLGYSERTRTNMEMYWAQQWAELKAEYAARGEICKPAKPEDVPKILQKFIEADGLTAEERLARRRSHATRGIPSGAIQISRHPDGTSTLMLDRIKVFAKVSPPAGEPWYRLYYEHRGEDYFVNTRFGELVDAYEIGDERLYIRDYGNAFFLEAPPC